MQLLELWLNLMIINNMALCFLFAGLKETRSNMNLITNLIKKIFLIIIDLVRGAISLILGILSSIYEKFIEISIPEKMIFLNTIPAFFAVILPVAKYYIFGTFFYINNTLAVYMLGIIFIMIITIYLTGLTRFLIRISINAYYLFWIIYLPLAGELTKADPYRITAGYYINIAVPVIYIIASLFSYFYSYD